MGPAEHRRGQWRGVWNLVERRRSATFEEFWRQWAEDDLDVSDDALATLYQNTIDRGYRDPLPAGASLRRPAPGPHNYALTTTRRGWSVVALRPANGDDLDLGLFDDRDQRQLLALSREGGDRIDFVAIDSNQGRRPLPDDYYPQVTGFGETGPYDLQLADPALACSPSGSSPWPATTSRRCSTPTCAPSTRSGSGWSRSMTRRSTPSCS